MANDGKRLENLVRQVEELLLPKGFTVTANRRVFNDEGVPVAEFDIEIAGRIGTTDMTWLIECRDREGPAPGSWIEQLVGRRDRFGFNKIMAVSTTGFAPGAVTYAKDAGIELRNVGDMDIAKLPEWLGMTHLTQQTHLFTLHHADVLRADVKSQELGDSLAQRLASASGADKILRPFDSERNVSFSEAFLNALSGRQGVIEGLTPNGDSKPIKARVEYDDASYFVIDTEAGAVPIRVIGFIGEVRLIEERVPFDAAREYRREGTNEKIAQTVSFPVDVRGSKFALELHNLADTGETHVLLRKIT